MMTVLYITSTNSTSSDSAGHASTSCYGRGTSFRTFFWFSILPVAVFGCL